MTTDDAGKTLVVPKSFDSGKIQAVKCKLDGAPASAEQASEGNEVKFYKTKGEVARRLMEAMRVSDEWVVADLELDIKPGFRGKPPELTCTDATLEGVFSDYDYSVSGGIVKVPSPAVVKSAVVPASSVPSLVGVAVK
jgi:hypothetical protein